MKNSRFQYLYRKSASKLHQQVGDLLRTSDIFNGYEIYQEYPVQRVAPRYFTSSHHFDWVIPKLKLVIEVHGKQHYVPTDFSGKLEHHEVLSAFKAQQDRDISKKQAAQEAGFIYIEIPYYESKFLDEKWICDAIKNQEQYVIEEKTEESSVWQELIVERKRQDKERRKEYLKSDQHQNKLSKAREYRKEQYRKMKEWKDG